MSDLGEIAKNRLVMLPGHFAHPVRVEAVEEIGAGVFLLKVRDSSGHLDETQVTGEELESALAAQGPVTVQTDARDLFHPERLYHQAIEEAAYFRWLRRGRPISDPRTDWFAAEAEVVGARQFLITWTRSCVGTIRPSRRPRISAG